jgi:RimJ/RimL family protein N-acetyltransferase
MTGATDYGRNWMPHESLPTARLRLEPWDESHTALLVRLSAMTAVMRFIGDGTLWPRARAEDVAAANREHWRRHGFGWRAAVDRETGEAIGDEGFEQVGAPSLLARIQPANEASLAVARAIGLTRESESRGLGGEPIAVLRVTAEDWRGSQTRAPVRPVRSRA